MRQTATAFAPGSVGNVGPGLDILGLAVRGAGDEVTLTRASGSEILVEEAGHPDIPADPLRHASAIAARAVFMRLRYSGGAVLRLRKGLPLSGGQGGSAASAVAGAVAANHLIDGGLDDNALLECALVAESAVAGRHADNLAPSLLGGLVLVRSLDPVSVLKLPVPASLRIVLVHPAQQLRTRDARGVLPDSVPRDVALAQATRIAEMVAGAYADDVTMFGRAIDDRIAEPVRAPLLPGFVPAKQAAIDAGALGCSISGAGPTSFAVVANDAAAEEVAAAMKGAYAASGIASTVRITTPDLDGATVR